MIDPGPAMLKRLMHEPYPLPDYSELAKQCWCSTAELQAAHEEARNLMLRILSMPPQPLNLVLGAAIRDVLGGDRQGG